MVCEKLHHYVCLEKVSFFCSKDRECFCPSSKDNIEMAKVSVSLCFPIYHTSRSSYKAYSIQCLFHLQDTKGMKNVNPYGDWLKEICYSSENKQHHSDTHVREMARFYWRAAWIFSVKWHVATVSVLRLVLCYLSYIFYSWTAVVKES